MSKFKEKRNINIMLDNVFKSIQYGIKNGKCMKIDIKEYPSELCEVGSCFITLKLDGSLRGCIGTIEANGPLILNIVENSFKAAFCDPRFKPVTQSEFGNLVAEISILSSPEKVEYSSEHDLLEKITPNEDGLILTFGNHKATFLPSVWKELPTPKLFLQHLKYKAGLMPDFWNNDITIEKYKAEKISK